MTDKSGEIEAKISFNQAGNMGISSWQEYDVKTQDGTFLGNFFLRHDLMMVSKSITLKLRDE